MAPAKSAIQKPKTEDDWFQLGFDIQQLFDGAPIDEEDLFAGRAGEVRRIIEAVFSKSKHVVLFGEKGVGKTSLSNVFWKRFSKTLQSFVVARVQAGPHDTFSSLWLRALEELQASARSSGKTDYINLDTDFHTLTPSQVRRELQKCKPKGPIYVLDPA